MKRRKAYASLNDYFTATGERQNVFAKKARITQAHLSCILSGLRTPSLPVALRIANLANVPVESLLGKVHAEHVA